MVEQVLLHFIQNYAAAHGVNHSSPTYLGRIQGNLEHLMQWFFGITEGQVGVNHTFMRDSFIIQLPYHIVHGPQSL